MFSYFTNLDGSLYFATRVDPLFIILPCLKATSTKVKTREIFLIEKTFYNSQLNLSKYAHVVTFFFPM